MATAYLPLRWHVRAGARDVALEHLPVLNQGYGTEAGRDWDGEWIDAVVMGVLPADRRR